MKMEESLLFFTFSSHPIGYSKANEDSNAATHGGRLVGVLAVSGQHGGVEGSVFPMIAYTIGVEIGVTRFAFRGIVTALEDATISEG